MANMALQERHVIFILITTGIISLTYLYAAYDDGSGKQILPPFREDQINTPRKQKPKICSDDVRQKFLEKTCATIDKKYYLGKSSGHALVDEKHKLLFCLISKTGTKSWKTYIKQQNDNLSHTHKPGLHSSGLQIMRRPTLEDIRGKYRKYFKFTVVRHPLQRLVSGYYEAVVHRKRLLETTGGIVPDLERFLELVANGDWLDADDHWTRYTDSCRVCDIKYDLILRSETSDDDLVKYKEARSLISDIEINKGHSYEDKVENGEAPPLDKDENTAYKYDKIFADIQTRRPKLMDDILKIYEADMELFGYHWNKEQHRSSCGINVNGSICC